ncbi:15185_t:CDS:2, partial [Racocetra fulgida]
MVLRANKRTNRATFTNKTHRQWNAREKIAIILYYKNSHSKSQTASKFNIETKQLRDWISKKSLLLKAQPGLKRLNKGPSPKYPELETFLVEWIKERRKNQQAVSRHMIQMKAKTLFQEHQWQLTCPKVLNDESQEIVNDQGMVNEDQGMFSKDQGMINESQETFNESQETFNESQETFNESQETIVGEMDVEKENIEKM